MGMIIDIVRPFFLLLGLFWAAFSLICTNFIVNEGDLGKGVIFGFNLIFANYEKKDVSSAQEWGFIILTLVIIPIVMINMLVAMMGDAYNEVNARSTIAKLRQQLEMMLSVMGAGLAIKNIFTCKCFAAVKGKMQEEVVGGDIATLYLFSFSPKNVMYSSSAKAEEQKQQIQALKSVIEEQAEELNSLESQILKSEPISEMIEQIGTQFGIKKRGEKKKEEKPTSALPAIKEKVDENDRNLKEMYNKLDTVMNELYQITDKKALF